MGSTSRACAWKASAAPRYVRVRSIDRTYTKTMQVCAINEDQPDAETKSAAPPKHAGDGPHSPYFSQMRDKAMSFIGPPPLGPVHSASGSLGTKESPYESNVHEGGTSPESRIELQSTQTRLLLERQRRELSAEVAQRTRRRHLLMMRPQHPCVPSAAASLLVKRSHHSPPSAFVCLGRASAAGRSSNCCRLFVCRPLRPTGSVFAGTC